MSKVILVADDNQYIRRAACALLMDTQHVSKCIQAENGLEALKLAKEMTPDLVILDYSMPVMDGLEAARQIHEALPAMPIVLFTLHDAVLQGRDLWEVGVAATVSKEKAATALVPTVSSLLAA